MLKISKIIASRKKQFEVEIDILLVLMDLEHFCSVWTFGLLFIIGLGLSAEEAPQFGPESGELKQKFTDIFKSKTQAEWCEIFDNADACVMPILHLNKVHNHPHSMYHNSFLPTPSGHKVPKPAPNLDRTPACSTVAPDPKVGEHTMEILKEHGFKSKEMKSLLENGVVVQNDEAKSKL